MPGKALIIIPTYNEMENITRLIPAVYQYTDSNVHLLIVDDNSPDGTGAYIKDLSEKDERIHLLSRPKKMGLGTAYTDGFRYAIEYRYDYIFEMDADFSHDPKELPVFLRGIENADLVLGSRYLTGVNVINWPMQRLLLSWFANQYTKCITGMPVHDSTGGYKCFRREVLESIDLTKIKSNGYAFQIEMNFKTWKKGFRIKEIPIIFVDRYMGKSKMSRKIVREAVTLVWKLRILGMFGKIR
ncbi:MAG: polyprenol monophosphomannose synthase [Ignavibacteriaceae bacterium]|nr:polyprenol monophosphomannose synthase [Ignavibacteriaceae bacterium]